MDYQTTDPPSRKTIYLFPNALTTGALLCGFVAMIRATQNDFQTASLLIALAAIFDGLDGRVARLLNAQSKFGEQFDSMSDLVSFGVAPAISAYLWALHQFGRLGAVVVALYCLCAAIRLARFNVRIGVVSKRYFQGLPSPAAATMVSAMIYMLSVEPSVAQYFPALLSLIVVLVVGILMVSNVPYYSFKEIDPRRAVPFKLFVLFALVAAFLYLSPHLVIFIGLFGYAFSGFVVWLYRWIKTRQMKTFIRD